MEIPVVAGNNGGGILVLCYIIIPSIMGIPVTVDELPSEEEAKKGAVRVW